MFGWPGDCGEVLVIPTPVNYQDHLKYPTDQWPVLFQVPGQVPQGFHYVVKLPMTHVLFQLQHEFEGRGAMAAVVFSNLPVNPVQFLVGQTDKLFVGKGPLVPVIQELQSLDGLVNDV